MQFDPTDTRDVAKNFATAFKAKYNADPTHLNAHAYDQIMLIADVVKRGGKDAQSIRDGLAATKGWASPQRGVRQDQQNTKMDTIHYMETKPDMSWTSLKWNDRNDNNDRPATGDQRRRSRKSLRPGGLGLTLIYGVLVQINFAHADFVTLGAFAAYFFMHLIGGGYILSIAVAFVVGAALGWLINAAIFTPLRHKGNELLPLIATIGVSVMMQNLMLAWFGPIPYAFETQYSSEVIRFAGIFVSWQSVIIIIVSILTIVLLYAFMKFTFLGKALRAVAQDRETAGLMGINPNYLIMLTFVIASALAGMGGAMLAPVLVLTPFAGTSVIVKAFAIVIIGGFGNVEGTILPALSSA